jgi:Mn2+/Fe2+ NRAMP family transporter
MSSAARTKSLQKPTQQALPESTIPSPTRVARSIGLGLITGAADDDPSASGTYASAGAAIGPAFLWTAPVTFPMMVTVVYLSSKRGQVAGKGLFEVIRDRHPRTLLYAVLAAVFANQGGYETPTTFVAGFQPALTIGAATVALGAAAALLIPRRRRSNGLALAPAPQAA